MRLQRIHSASHHSRDDVPATIDKYHSVLFSWRDLVLVSSPPSSLLPSSHDFSSAVFLPALFAMSEIPSLFALRPIIQRHYKAAMYHPFVEAIALTLVDVPITFIILLLYSIVLYFLVGLQASAGQFLCVNIFSSTRHYLWLAFVIAYSSYSSSLPHS